MFPLPRMVQYGNVIPVDDVQFTSVINEDVLSFSNITSVLNPTNIAQKQSDFRSFKFKNNITGSTLILPSQPIGLSSYKDIYEKGMATGTGDYGPDNFDASVMIKTLQSATIVIDGEEYNIRLMNGIPDPIMAAAPGIVIDDPKYYNPMTEWEIYVYSIWNNLPASMTSGVNVPAELKIQHVANFAGTTRRFALVLGNDGNRTSPRSICRSRFDSAASSPAYGFSQICSTSLVPLWTANAACWWPIFEKKQ